MSTYDESELASSSEHTGPVEGRGCLTGLGVLFLGFACLGVLATLSQVMLVFLMKNQQNLAGTPQLTTSMIALNVCIYTGLTVVGLWIGIGLLRAKRWARAITLAGAWLVLIGGIAGMCMLPMTMTMMDDMMAMTTPTGAGAPSPGTMKTFMMVTMLVAMFGFYIFLPGIVILGLRGAKQRHAVQVLDPRPSWTDGVPIPVLIVIVALAIISLSIISWPLGFGIAPLFGTYVTGGAAYGVAAVIGVAAVLIAVGLARLDRRAWWAAVLFIGVMAISFGRTLAHSGMEPFYATMLKGMPPEMMEAMRQMYVNMANPMVYGLVGSATAALLYMLGIRRYFKGSPGTGVEIG